MNNKQDAKNNAEIQTEWTKTTWKTFEETIRGLGVILTDDDGGVKGSILQ